jgi:hypothetical protein
VSKFVDTVEAIIAGKDVVAIGYVYTSALVSAPLSLLSFISLMVDGGWETTETRKQDS